MRTAQFEELYVLSDLHIGGTTSRPIFFQGQTLARLFDHLAKRKPPAGGPLAVLLNGDVIDTLAEDVEGYVADPAKAESIIQAIAGHAAFSPVFQGMGRFVSEAGHVLVFAIGNHDVEIMYPSVQETLLHILAGDDPAKRSRVVFSTSGTGVRCEVGRKDGPRASVLCIHGNEFDEWNAFSPEAINRILRASVYGKHSELLATPPNAGTQLVKDVMNDIKRDWPFVDLLKPEIDTVFNVLIALDPKRIGAIAGVAKAYGHAAVEGSYRTQHILGAGQAVRPEGAGLKLEPGAELAKLIGEGSNDDELLAATWELAMAPTPDVEELASGADEVLGVWRAVKNWFSYSVKAISASPREALRAALADWGGGQETWNLDGKCDVFDGLARVSPQADVIVAGHTHLRRQKWLSPDTKQTLYLNTGTWARLMRLTREVLENELAFAQVWNALPAASTCHMPAHVLTDQPTVAVIRQRQGNTVEAALCEFSENDADGFSLVKEPPTKKVRGATPSVNESVWERVGRKS